MILREHGHHFGLTSFASKENPFLAVWELLDHKSETESLFNFKLLRLGFDELPINRDFRSQFPSQMDPDNESSKQHRYHCDALAF